MNANIQESPFEGIGKPKQLKYDWIGYWSRRIMQEHRLIYEVLNDKILIRSLKVSMIKIEILNY
ncbi:MAG: Txe/YoeB family addiction module toxin [Ginsengibacter sp.]